MNTSRHKPDSDIWGFAYGSLMWHPNFEYNEKQAAQLHGYYRALCIIPLNIGAHAIKPVLYLG